RLDRFDLVVTVLVAPDSRSIPEHTLVRGLADFLIIVLSMLIRLPDLDSRLHWSLILVRPDSAFDNDRRAAFIRERHLCTIGRIRAVERARVFLVFTRFYFRLTSNLR